MWRIRFAKGILLREAASTGHGGDLGPSAGFPRLHGIKSYASRGAPTSSPSLPCFCESASGGNQIRHTVTSGFAPRYARYIANAEINSFILLYHSRDQRVKRMTKIDLFFIAVPDG